MISRDRGSPAVQAAGIALTALDCMPWRGTAVAAAVFPGSLDSVPPGGCVQFPRLDADIWRQLTTRHPSWAGSLGFGDYGVADTRLPPPGPARSFPSLRYTTDVCWHYYHARAPAPAPGGVHDIDLTELRDRLRPNLED